MLGEFFRRGWKVFKIAEHLHFADLVLEAVFGLRTLTISIFAAVGMMFFAAADPREWSATQVVIASLAVFALVFVIVAALTVICRVLGSGWQATIISESNDKGEPLPDWRIDELFSYIDPDILNVGSDEEGPDRWEIVGGKIRDALSLGRLKIWGRPIDDHAISFLETTAPMREIDAAYWRSATFSYHFFDSTAAGKAHTDVPSHSGLPVYTDLQVNQAQATRIWSAGTPATLRVGLHDNPLTIGDYEVVCALTVINGSAKDLTRCIVQLEQFSDPYPTSMPSPMPLRTDGQIRDGRKGRFTLSPEQPKTVPILFRLSTRKNEWYFFDERRDKFFVSAGAKQLVIGVYCEADSGKFLVNLPRASGWTPLPSIKTVPDNYKLSSNGGDE